MDEIVDYKQILQEIKIQVQTSQHKAIFAVNRELILLYWNIGKTIINCQTIKGWGSKVVENLANDLRIEFPDIKGFSLRNLKYMRKFAIEFPDIEFVQTLSAQISWSHNIMIMEKLKFIEQKNGILSKLLKMGGR